MADHFSEKHEQMWLNFAKEKSYYNLKVPAGTYSSDNIFGLVWEVFMHRLSHWRKGHGWID